MLGVSVTAAHRAAIARLTCNGRVRVHVVSFAERARRLGVSVSF
jgi:hypothetical protein